MPGIGVRVTVYGWAGIVIGVTESGRGRCSLVSGCSSRLAVGRRQGYRDIAQW